MGRHLMGLIRDEGSSTTTEYSIVFALIFTLVCATSAFPRFRSQRHEYVAFAVSSQALIPAQSWNSGSTFNKRHYHIGELAKMWGVGRETVRLLVKDEPGVIRIRNGRKKAHTKYSLPESVAQRIYTRLQSAA